MSECRLSENVRVSTTLICDVYGPLKAGDTHKVSLTYDVSNVEAYTPSITWTNVEVFSQSGGNFKDMNLQNNAGEVDS